MIVGALAAAAATLLIVAGLAKIRTPAPAESMIVMLVPLVRQHGRARILARVAGMAELVAGIATLAFGGRIAVAALGACYLVLTVVAVRLTVGPQRAACGCFGTADGEVGAAHVVLDLAALAIAGWALVDPPGAITALFATNALSGTVALTQALLLAALGYLSITALPALTAARRLVEERP